MGEGVSRVLLSRNGGKEEAVDACKKENGMNHDVYR